MYIPRAMLMSNILCLPKPGAVAANRGVVALFQHGCFIAIKNLNAALVWPDGRQRGRK